MREKYSIRGHRGQTGARPAGPARAGTTALKIRDGVSIVGTSSNAPGSPDAGRL
jgi:hypothetical protein